MRVTLFILFLLFACSAQADILKYEDDEGVFHFTDAPEDKRFKPFMSNTTAKQVKPLTPGKYLYKTTDRKGNYWAVRKTDNRNTFIWYSNGKREITHITEFGLYIPSFGFAKLSDDGVVIDDSTHWPVGSPGYNCVIAIKNEIKKRR